MLSGSAVLSSVIFYGINDSEVLRIEEFMITDDNYALELNEQYQIRFLNSSIVDNVVLGQPTTITILDNDG